MQRTVMQKRLHFRPLPLVVLALLFSLLTAAIAQTYTHVTNFGQPQIGAVHGSVPILSSVKVVNFGTVIYTGKMDVNPTLTRIRNAEKVNEKDDGGIYTNSEGSLPRSGDSQYYREFVHVMSGFPFPGPQRLVIGKNGVVYYTGDHYATFHKVN